MWILDSVVTKVKNQGRTLWATAVIDIVTRDSFYQMVITEVVVSLVEGLCSLDASSLFIQSLVIWLFVLCCASG